MVMVPLAQIGIQPHHPRPSCSVSGYRQHFRGRRTKNRDKRIDEKVNNKLDNGLNEGLGKNLTKNFSINYDSSNTLFFV